MTEPDPHLTMGRTDEHADPELTASVLSAISDAYGRLLLADPDRYPVERLLRHARWFLERGPASL